MIALYALFGAIIGSFLNVCIDRIPAGQSLLRPPSRCPSCGYTLKPQDNIPIISYLWLRGKCRLCASPIPRRVLAVEMLTAALFAFLWWRYGPGLPLAAATVYTCLLLVLSVIDFEQGLLLNKIVYPSMALALGFSWFDAGIGPVSALIGGAAAMTILVLIILISRGGMGWGDSKMAGLMGLMLGFPAVLAALLLAAVAGGLSGAILLIAKRKGRKDTIPFGPFLAAGAWITLIAGASIIGWYRAIGFGG